MLDIILVTLAPTLCAGHGRRVCCAVWCLQGLTDCSRHTGAGRWGLAACGACSWLTGRWDEGCRGRRGRGAKAGGFGIMAGIGEPLRSECRPLLKAGLAQFCSAAQHWLASSATHPARLTQQHGTGSRPLAHTQLTAPPARLPAGPLSCLQATPPRVLPPTASSRPLSGEAPSCRELGWGDGVWGWRHRLAGVFVAPEWCWGKEGEGMTNRVGTRTA